MIDFSRLKEILIISITSGIISNALVLKLKVREKHKKHLCIISLIISFVMALLFCISFTNLTFVETLWAGGLSFIGADAIYISLEKGIIKNITHKEK